MKMTNAGTANILRHADYSRNCNLGACGRLYLAPVPGLSDVQLFVNFGNEKPTALEFSVINLCQPGVNAPATTDRFVLGWNGEYWYGVFKNFQSTLTPSTFLISLNTGDQTFFSEQYQTGVGCEELTKVGVCYPSNYDAEDLNGIYIGAPKSGQPYSGDPALFYKHQFWTRQGEVIEVSNKVTYTANSKRNFSSKLEKTFEFRPELMPGWYKDYLLSVYFRGNILINDTPALVTDLAFEDVDVDYWKAYAVLIKEVKGSFGCAPFVCPGDYPPICVPASFAPPIFPDAIVGYPYSATVILGGTAPFTAYNETLPSWAAITITGNQLEIKGTPTGDAGSAPILFSVMNECGDQTLSDGLVNILVEPPVTEVLGDIYFSARNVVVSISQGIPCDVTFPILGTYDRDGVPTEFFVLVPIVSGSNSSGNVYAAEVEHYIITCIKPTTSGETTIKTSVICGGINYKFTLEISEPC